MTTPLLITGGHVVTMDDALGELPRADVLIFGDRIEAVGRHLGAPGARVIDASGKIVLPGLVDTHRHTWQTVLRGLGADINAQEYRSCIRGSFGPHVRPDDVYAATYLGALEALDAGITTMVDWAHITNTPEHADAGIAALRDVGGRAVYAYGTPNDHETAAWYQNSGLRHPADIRRVRSEVLDDDQALVTMAMAARPPHIIRPEVMQHDWLLGRELDLWITVDGGLGGGSWNGTPWGPGGHEPIRALEKAGLLDARTTFVHCNNLTDAELDLIASAGAHIRMSPPDPWELTTRDVLGFATRNGARATGMADRIGSISPGKQADVVILKARALNLEPMNNAIGLVVLQAHPGNVDTVLVAGRVVKSEGELPAEKVARAVELATASRDRLFATAGLTPGWGCRPALQPQWRW